MNKTCTKSHLFGFMSSMNGNNSSQCNKYWRVFVSYWKSLESMNCHVSSKMSRTALNILFSFVVFFFGHGKMCLCKSSFVFHSVSFNELMVWRGGDRRYAEWKNRHIHLKMRQPFVWQQKLSSLSETREPFSIYVFEHMSCNKIHQCIHLCAAQTNANNARNK